MLFMDKLIAMQLFVRIVQRGSFSLVADEMCMAQSSVSKKISALEQHLGSRLLSRNGRKIGLTEVGSIYFEQCVDVLDRVERAETEAKKLTAQPAGQLRVALPTTFGRLHVLPLISRFMALYPKVKMNLTLLDRKVDLIGENTDVALRIGKMEDSSQVASMLGFTMRAMVASPDYLKQHGTPQHPKELIGRNCLIYNLLSTNSSWPLRDQGKDILIPVDGNFRANTGDALKEMAISGNGIAFLPTWMLKLDIDEGRLIEVLPKHAPAALPVYALFPKDKDMPLKVRCFIDFIKQEFKGVGILQNNESK